jgi:hypothetical protein
LSFLYPGEKEPGTTISQTTVRPLVADAQRPLHSTQKLEASILEHLRQHLGSELGLMSQEEARLLVRLGVLRACWHGLTTTVAV